MLYPKNGPKALEADDGDKIHGPPTPHRIKMPSELEDTRSRRAIHDKVKKTNGVALNPLQSSAQKPLIRRRRKQNSKRRPTEIVPTDSNHKVTDYFQVRRSVRKCKTTVLEEKQRDLEKKILSGSEDGLEGKYKITTRIRGHKNIVINVVNFNGQVRDFPGKGRGIVTTRAFVKGEFVVEYIGDLIDQTTARKREARYAQDKNMGCYCYYFQHRNQHYCIDATEETGKLGRLANHSRNGNMITRIVEVNSVPHLVLIAKEDIPKGVELTYDYGDRSKEALLHHPWLAL